MHDFYITDYLETDRMLRLAGMSYDGAENRFHNEVKVSTMRAELIVRCKRPASDVWLASDSQEQKPD